MYNQQNIQAALSKIENKQIREKFNRNGFYRATVVSNDDPLRLGRIKIRIPSLHGVNTDQLNYVDDGSLPYAFPGVCQGAGYLEGQYLLPSQGHTVWVSFETGTDNFIYFGGLYSTAPGSEKYVYKTRNINNGNPIKVYSNDIPSDYHSEKHVLYRSWSGDTVFIDESRPGQSIVIENRYGNKISFNERTINFNTKDPLNAHLPYMDILYCDSKYLNGLDFEIESSKLFINTDLSDKVEKIAKGNIVVFISKDKIKGTGIVSKIGSNLRIQIISQN